MIIDRIWIKANYYLQLTALLGYKNEIPITTGSTILFTILNVISTERSEWRNLISALKRFLDSASLHSE